MRFGIILLLLFTTHAFAQKRLAVLPIEVAKDARKSVTSSEVHYLTELLRSLAGNELKPHGFVVMTQANFQTVVGSQTTLSECVGSCIVETGVNLKAHFVVSAKLSQVFGQFRLLISAFNTKTGQQVTSLAIKIKNKSDFEREIEQRAPELFGSLLPPKKQQARSQSRNSVVVGESLKQHTGRQTIVSFRSSPKEALVTVDGVSTCKTPCQRKIRLGEHEVSMSLSGYLQRVQRVSIGPHQTIDWRLNRDAGTVEVISTMGAGGAVNVYRSGERMDRLPNKTPALLELAPGEYSIVVGDPSCHYTDRKSVQVARGERTVIEFSPRPKIVELALSVVDASGNDLEARVVVDDVDIGSSLAPALVPKCAKAISVRHQKFPSKRISPVFNGAKQIDFKVVMGMPSARTSAQEVIEVEASGELLYEQAQDALDARDFTRAERLLSTAANKNYGRAYGLLTWVMRMQGRFKECNKFGEMYLAFEPNGSMAVRVQKFLDTVCHL